MAPFDAALWTIELSLFPSTTVTEPAAREALRGVKTRRRKGDPMTCACCPATLGASPFTLVCAQVLGDVEGATNVTAGVCRKCGPTMEAAAQMAPDVARAIWPDLAGYELAQRE